MNCQFLIARLCFLFAFTCLGGWVTPAMGLAMAVDPAFQDEDPSAGNTEVEQPKQDDTQAKSDKEPAKEQQPQDPEEKSDDAEPETPAITDPLAGYRTFGEIESELQTLAKSDFASLTSLGKTAQGRDLWLLTLSDAPEADRPAIVILGNVHAPHLLGRELSLRLAKSILDSANDVEAEKNLLKHFTIYVIPSPTPDATEKNFQKPYREHLGNSTATDDDRDFTTGEDPPVDLNSDGWITLLRVADPFGTHRAHDKDPRVMVPIDESKAEKGTHRIYVEARDSDEDKQFGEDASDGVEFNRNFTFNYPYFGRGAGPHQVSEIETRAIADFLFDHPNIGAVLCFSLEDNLMHPWKGSAGTDEARIKTKILTKDQAHTDRLAAKFKELVGESTVPSPPTGAGSFSEWAYFHYGRWSFASRGWGITKPKADASKTDGEKKENESDKKPAADEPKPESSPAQPQAAAAGGQPPRQGGRGMDRGGFGGRGAGRAPAGARADAGGSATETANSPEEDLAALDWFEKNEIAGFADWTPIEHPDFKGKQVEVGGFKPLFRLNPPASMIDALVKPHHEFLLALKSHWPKIEITELKAKQVGPGLFDIRCKIVNTGELPTMPLIGELNRQAYPIMVELVGAEKARWLKGSARVSVSRLEARGGSQEIHWMLHLDAAGEAQPEFKIRAVAPTLSPIEQPIEWSTESP